MRRGPAAHVLLAALSVSLIATLVALDVPTAAPPATPVLEREDPTEPDEWLLAQRAFPIEEVPPDAFERAAAEAAAIGEETADADPALAEAAWSLVGPRNIGGRIVDVVVDPVLPDTVYVAAATGGVWKSTDAGATFQTAWPDDLTQSLGALAIASDGTLYAGTGEANNGGGSVVYGGSGVYRSRDRGETWELVGLEDSGTIGRIAVDPANPSRVFVAATGNMFVPGGERGLYRSLDGGDTWELVLPGENPTTGAVDVAIDPQNPQRVFAAMWERIRFPDLRVYGGVGSGLFRSDDGGATWQRLAGGLPAQSLSVGRIGVAIAPSHPNVVYAIVIQTSGSFQGFYLSLDGGSTWVQQPGTQVGGTQSSFGWWFGRIYVDPANPLHVYVHGVQLAESQTAGVSWVNASGVHADQHGMAWDPKVPGRVYLGNDGGFYRSDSNGSASGWVEATDQPFTQFYSLDVSEQDAARVVGGAQDNGCLRSWGGSDWNGYGCGDGLATLINPQNQDQYYGCSQYGSCGRYGGGSFGSTTSNRRGWFTPLVFDPNDPSVMYYGGNRLNRSTNGGGSWTAISPDLTGGPGRDTSYPFGTMTTIAAAKSDPNVVYVGTDDARVWRTTDLGATWDRLDNPELPQRWVTRVAVDPADADVAYVTFSGFRNGEDDAHVYRTADGGATWEPIGAGLPNAPVNDVILVGEEIVVATDVGVYLTRDLGETWLRVGSGLPLAPVHDIRYQAATGSVSAATFGRGIYRVTLPG